jgi:phospholipase/carboxylesterase
MGQIARAEPKRGTATSLVMLLHGYGANGADLISLADLWAPRLPAAAFVAPDAPERLPYQGSDGYQWFDLSMRDPTELWRGVSGARAGLEQLIASELQRYKLGVERLALVGFSQGTMMALHVAPRMARPAAAVVGLSGVIAGAERLGPEVTARPPMLLTHGSEDEVIPVEAVHLTREALAAADIGVEWHIRPGLGHGIDEETAQLAGSFLAQHLARGLSR